jgi:hypothetical protein
MDSKSDPIANIGETSSDHPTFSDLAIHNERDMWWAEFDLVGEEEVRTRLGRNSYTPSGIEFARQWLHRREFLQLRQEMRTIWALAEKSQVTATESLRSSFEAYSVASAAASDSRAATEIAAKALKEGRILSRAGIVAVLFALGGLAMMLASMRS